MEIKRNSQKREEIINNIKIIYKMTIFIAIVFIIVFASSGFFSIINYTNSLYFFNINLDNEINVSKTMATVSRYHPEWTGGYNAETQFIEINTPYDTWNNIHIKVTNENDGRRNETEEKCYLRIVTEMGEPFNIPGIYEYDFYQYEGEILAMKDSSTYGYLYGPFTLPANTEFSKFFTLHAGRANTAISAEEEYKLGIQVVRDVENGWAYKPIAEAPLWFKTVYSSTLSIEINYFNQYNTEAGIIKSQTIPAFEKGHFLNFTSADDITNYDIQFPAGFTFVGAQCYDIYADWNYRHSIAIGSDLLVNAIRIDVFLQEEVSNIVNVTLKYYKVGGGSTEIAPAKVFDIEKGNSIDFTNATSLATYGITLPADYKFDYAQCYAIYSNWGPHNPITIPADFTEHSVTVNVFLYNTITVTIDFYKVGGGTSTIAPSKILSIEKGNGIDFTSADNLASYGITLLSGYKFSYAQCYAIYSDWGPHNPITVPTDFAGSNAVVNVFLEEIVTIPSSISIKLCNGGSTTVIGTQTITLDASGNHTFTFTELKSFAPFASLNSFGIVIFNPANGSTSAVGNIASGSAPITFNYDTNIGGYSLKFGMELRIIAWW